MVRVNPVLAEATDVLALIAIIGGATAFFAATIAVAQNDIKKVLAYSTVSQLGYMFLAVGSGGYVAAIFHMITHAFFKALLFLGAGSVIHGMHDDQDMRHMGALRKLLPITAATFIVGWLAIAGVPPFSGFWSKDDILLYAFDYSPVLWAIGFVTAILTGYYTTRQVMLVFYGEASWEENRPAAVPKGSPPTGVGHRRPCGDHGEDHAHGSRTSRRGSCWPRWSCWRSGAFGGGRDQPPFGDLDFLHQWLEPVVEGSERTLGATAEDYKWFLLAPRGPSRSSASSSAGSCTTVAGSRRSSRRSSPRAGTTTRRSARSWAVPAGRASTAPPPSTPRSSTARSTAPRSGIRPPRNDSDAVRPATCATTRCGIGAGAVLLLGWFVARGLV